MNLAGMGLILLVAPRAGLALEKPTPEEWRQYNEDGTLAERIEKAKLTGNHKAAPHLVRNARQRLLKAAGDTVVEYSDSLLLAPPADWQGGLPSTGTPNVLVLLIDFPDFPHAANQTPADVSSKFFGTGDTSQYPYESLSLFYRRSSYQHLSIQGNVLGWYTAQYNRSHYGTAGREALIMEAINAYNATHDFAQYDNDHDGVIDAFFIKWTGPDNGWGSFWWACQPTWDANPSYRVDGKVLGRYVWSWISRPQGQVYQPHVDIHETGHLLGLPDLYDYKDIEGPMGGVGGLDMMDANWGDHNCFSKMMLGWLDPIVVSAGDQTVCLLPTASVSKAVLIMPGATGSTLFDEFFMIQHRTRTLNDDRLPADGCLIWHVNSTLNTEGTDFLYDNSYTPIKYMRLMEADGLEEIEQALRADAGDFYGPETRFGLNSTPSSRNYSGFDTGVCINAFTPVGNAMYVWCCCGACAPSGATGLWGSTGQYTDKVRLTWDASHGAADYLIYRSATQTPGCPEPPLARVWSPATAWDDFTAEPGVHYYYSVKARNASADAPCSDSVLGWRYADPRPTVYTFTIDGGAETTTSRTVTLRWTCPHRADHYMASESPDFAGATWEWDQLWEHVCSFVLSPCSGVKTVYFKVKEGSTESLPVTATIRLDEPLLVVTQFRINLGAETTDFRTVKLNHNCTPRRPTDYMASESPTFVGATWQQPWGPNLDFELSPGNGVKTVFFKVRDVCGESAVVSDTITLAEPQPPPVVDTFAMNNGADTTASRAVTLNNTCSNSPTHYIASENASFSGAVWQTYSNAPWFTLSDGNATKTVYFKVANNGGGSSPVSDTITLAECAVVKSFSINNGAAQTASRTVKLYNTCSNDPTEYMASESSSFAGAVWRPYGTLTPSFVLSSGNGAKTVYFKVRNACGESASLSDTILLAEGVPILYVFSINNGSETTASRTVTLNNSCASSPPPTEYMAGENSDFSGGTWLPYSTAPSFLLSAYSGTKTVYFKVRNGAGECDYPLSVTILLIEPGAPAVTGLAINNGAATTTTRAVTLNNTCSNAPYEYIASERSDFSGSAGWLPYSTAPSFPLSPGNGGKPVFFKVRNAVGESAAVSDGIKLVESGIPLVETFAINNGAEITTSRTVTLNNTCSNAEPTEYMASERSDFAGAAWLPYSTAPSFELYAGDGYKIVYFKVRNALGETVPSINAITLTTPPVVLTFAINDGTATTTSGTVTLNNSFANSPTQYMASESSSFAGASWQSYSTAPSFTLSIGNGTKTVYLKVRNAGGESAPASDAITLTVPPPTAAEMTPNSGLNTGLVSITNLAGTGFLSGASVNLSKAGLPDIAATGVTVVSPVKITCTFDLTGAFLGARDVVVTNPDGQTGSLTDGFTVKPLCGPTPEWVGTCDGFSAKQVAVAGDYAYVAGSGPLFEELMVVEISDPAAPRHVGGVYNLYGDAVGVAVSGNYAYVPVETQGVDVINISNPATPSWVSNYEPPGSDSALHVAVSGNYAYVAYAYAGLLVLNISNPASLTRVGACDTSGYARRVAVSGSYAYVADDTAGLQVLNISNPAAPTRIGGYDTSGNAYGVAVSGDYAYVADYGAGLQIISISDPAAPTRVGGYDTIGHAYSVAVSGDYAYVADSTGGLQVINISNPAAPSWAGSYGGATGVYAYDVALSGDYAYVACDRAGLQVVTRICAALPATPWSPAPADQATNVSLEADLDWADVSGATTYDVYFGTTDPPAPAGNTVTSSWTLPTLVPETWYFWKVVAKNAAGDTPGPVWRFQALSCPVITQHPSGKIVCTGTGTTFTVAAGAEPLNYRWRKDGMPLSDGGSVSGGATATLSLNPVAPADAGSYDCMVSNDCGSATSNAAALEVFPALSIIRHPASQSACTGGSASFSVTAEGTPPPSYQWRKDGAALSDGGNVSGATTAMLTINPAGVADAGNYDCLVSNLCGSETSTTAVLTFLTTSPAADFDRDCDVDADDLLILQACASGPMIPHPAGCTAKDLDQDGDVDQSDFGLFQRCYSGTGKPADPDCAK